MSTKKAIELIEQMEFREEVPDRFVALNCCKFCEKNKTLKDQAVAELEKSEPTEWIKRIRRLIKDYDIGKQPNYSLDDAIEELYDACDIIDNQLEEIKRLKPLTQERPV